MARTRTIRKTVGFQMKARAMTELLKCPFCSGRAEVQEHRTFDSVSFSVICTVCKCRTSKFKCKSEAKKSWNSRKKEIETQTGELFGTRLEKFRKSEHLSCRQLSEIVDTSYKIINAAENGALNADVAMLVNIADYFGVSLDYLVRGLPKGE